MKPVASSRLQKALLVGLTALLLVGSTFTQRQMNRARADLGLTRNEPLKNAPPLLVFSTVVLGGFRGLIANALWIRAMEMQDQGRYFEMMQLSDWITKLTPHVATVWVVAAWNMSYNISIKFSDPPDRWRWVYRGIQLIRDEGLVYNPHSVELYRELGWHFLHKLGNNLDDAHLYYKARWASMMQDVLGGGHPDFDKLIHPPDDTWKKRARELREVYKLNPAIMKEVDQRYGPLEWRLPETHAIYWAVVGLEEAKTKDQLIKLRRLIFQSMQTAFRRGRLIELTFNHTVEFGPNLAIVDKTNAAYEEMIKAEQEAGNTALAKNIRTAHRNFLKDAVYFLYVHARVEAARQWLKYLREKYPKEAPQGTLEDYALSRVEEDAGETDMNRTISNITGAMTRSFFYLAIGEDDLAAGNMLLARNFWDRYMKKIVGGPSEGRVGLPPLSELRDRTLADVLNPKRGFPPELIAQLRTKLGLPAEVIPTNATPSLSFTNAPAGGTNAPPSSAPTATNAPAAHPRP
jgi:hypothetical protein